MAVCSSREATERRRSRKPAPTGSGLAKSARHRGGRCGKGRIHRYGRAIPEEGVVIFAAPVRTRSQRVSRPVAWRARRRERAGPSGFPAQHRPDVSRQPGMGRGERLRRRARRHHAAAGSPGGRGTQAQQLQRRVLLHRLARGADDRTLRHPDRRDPGRRHHAVGGHDRRSVEVDRLRHRPVRQVAPRRRPAGETEPVGAGLRRVYGIPRTSNEAQTTIAQGQTAPNTSFIWEGRAGSPPRNVKPFDLQTRRTIDRESVEKGSRSWSAASAPEAVLSLLPDDADPLSDADPSRLRRQDRRGRHRRRDGRSGLQRRPDARCDRSARDRAQHDRVLVRRQRRRGPAAVARIVGAVDGVLQQRDGGWHPDAVPGPLAREDPGGRVTNELVHEMDFLPTIAAAVGADIVPHDRAIDGVNQLPFFEGKQATSNRESVLLYANAQLRAVKWHDWKLHYVFTPEAGGPAVAPLMRLFNLLSDPKEETDIKDANPWVQSVTDRIVNEFTATIQRYPHVRPTRRIPTPPSCRRDTVERREFIAMLASTPAATIPNAADAGGGASCGAEAAQHHAARHRHPVAVAGAPELRLSHRGRPRSDRQGPRPRRAPPAAAERPSLG